MSRASSPNAEATFKSGLSDPGARTSITTSGRSPSKRTRAVANSPPVCNGSSGAVSNGPPAEDLSLNGLANAVAEDEETQKGIQSIKAMMQRRPFKHRTQVEYYALPGGVKVCGTQPSWRCLAPRSLLEGKLRCRLGRRVLMLHGSPLHRLSAP